LVVVTVGKVTPRVIAMYPPAVVDHVTPFCVPVQSISMANNCPAVGVPLGNPTTAVIARVERM